MLVCSFWQGFELLRQQKVHSCLGVLKANLEKFGSSESSLVEERFRTIAWMGFAIRCVLMFALDVRTCESMFASA